MLFALYFIVAFGAGYAPEHRSEPTGFAGHDTERDADADL